MLRSLMIVEDDDDLRLLIRLHFESDPDFELVGEASSAAEALEIVVAHARGISLIVLDHSLEGDMSGIDAAPLLKEAAPDAKIILFTAHENARQNALAEPAVDAFLLKTRLRELVPLARASAGLDAAS